MSDPLDSIKTNRAGVGASKRYARATDTTAQLRPAAHERIHVILRLGNSAMANAVDVAEALHSLADRIADLDSMQRLPLNIKDRNGNSIGECHLAIGPQGES